MAGKGKKDISHPERNLLRMRKNPYINAKIKILLYACL
jgi:hypothetical protein